MTLRNLGEDALLARILPALRSNSAVHVAAGDDCAVMKSPGNGKFLLLKTDCVVEGVHFRRRTDPRAIGRKAMMRMLSDFAAMSGVPQFAVVTLLISPRRPVTWVENLYRGLNWAAAQFHVAIVGGETSSSNGPAAIIVGGAGYVEADRCIRRSGGKAGDDLFVTGILGGSMARRHLIFRPRIREARWLTQHFKIHAMIDLSDGLGADLPRLAKASGRGFSLDQGVLPRGRGLSVRAAISDGEDYELLFAISPRHRQSLETKWRRQFPKTRLTRIGQFTRQRAQPTLPAGYVHFQERG